MVKQAVKIDVVSDIVCPWCYIGKRRLEKAILELSDNYDIQPEYHPFELNDSIPPQGVDRKEHLVQKFGSIEHYEHAVHRVTALAAKEGLLFNEEKQRVMPNTRKIHALIQFSKTRIEHTALVEDFFNAYFTNGIDLSDDKNVIAIATAAGLDHQEAETILTDPHSLTVVAEAESHVKNLGIQAVPFYIINSRHGLSGAQPSDVFKKLIEEVASGASTEV
jgi:predicted DsbA family dithiol-disulfide isomerase